MTKKIYLDYAATTPVDKNILKAMKPYFTDNFGNPSSLHSFGQIAMAAIDESRERIAKAIGADFREIIFTGSATEANNLALRGVIKACGNHFQKTPRIIVSSIEHESILETCRDLEKNGIEVIYLPVNRRGFVDFKKLESSLNEQIILVSIMFANNEIGTVQNIAKISKIIKEFKKQSDIYPLFHTDAVQAFQFLDCNVNELGVDLMTLSAHKIYGPKGIGLLYRRNFKLPAPDNKQFSNSKNQIQNKKFLDLSPLITGGGQEFSLHSGTENVAAIAGFAKAIELAVKNREKEFKRISELSDYFWKEIKKIKPKTQLNGCKIQNLKLKIPNIINIYFPNQNAQDLLIKLDLAGIAVSSGSACSTRSLKPSYVLKAIGLSEKIIKNSLRFSLGKFTTKGEINYLIKILKNIKL